MFLWLRLFSTLISFLMDLMNYLLKGISFIATKMPLFRFMPL